MDTLKKFNKSKYLILVPTSKEKIRKFEELWSKSRNLITSMTKNSDDYDEKYMKIKFNSDGKLLLNRMIEIPSLIIFFRAIFDENNNYYLQVFLDECFYQL